MPNTAADTPSSCNALQPTGGASVEASQADTRFVPIPAKLEALIERYGDAYHVYRRSSEDYGQTARANLAKARAALEAEIRSRLTLA